MISAGSGNNWSSTAAHVSRPASRVSSATICTLNGSSVPSARARNVTGNTEANRAAVETRRCAIPGERASAGAASSARNSPTFPRPRSTSTNAPCSFRISSRAANCASRTACTADPAEMTFCRLQTSRSRSPEVRPSVDPCTSSRSPRSTSTVVSSRSPQDFVIRTNVR